MTQRHRELCDYKTLGLKNIFFVKQFLNIAVNLFAIGDWSYD